MLTPAILSAIAAAQLPWSYVQAAAQMAMISTAVGGRVIRAQDGREIVRVTPEQAIALYQFATQQISNQTNNDAGIILAEFGGDCGRGRGNW